MLRQEIVGYIIRLEHSDIYILYLSSIPADLSMWCKQNIKAATFYNDSCVLKWFVFTQNWYLGELIMFKNVVLITLVII